MPEQTALELDLNVQEDFDGTGRRGVGSEDNLGALKTAVGKMSNEEKARLAFELLIDTGYDSHRAGIGKLL